MPPSGRYDAFLVHEEGETGLEADAGRVDPLGAGIGHYDVSDLTGEGYRFWQIGLTRSLRRFDLDLRYHDTSQWVPIVSSADRADARVAFSVTFAF